MVEYYRSKLLDEAGFDLHGFTKRTGGVSGGDFHSLNLAYNVGDEKADVRENLQRLKGALQTDLPLLRVEQVHGNKVIDASALPLEENASWASPPTIEADGIVAKGLDVVVAVQTADCVPLLLADPHVGVVAAVHVGWRGARNGVVKNCIRMMAEKGGSGRSIRAAVGPCICMGCYEVGEDVARYFPESSDPVKGKPGAFHFDLGLAVEVSLIAAGLTSDQIERIGACTACQSDALYSHRGTGAPTGRMLGFISGLR